MTKVGTWDSIRICYAITRVSKKICNILVRASWWCICNVTEVVGTVVNSLCSDKVWKMKTQLIIVQQSHDSRNFARIASTSTIRQGEECKKIVDSEVVL